MDLNAFSNDPLSQLNLSGITPREAVTLLPPGQYVVTVQDAKLEKNSDGTKRLDLVLSDEGGEGIITARLNLWSNNEDAKRISLEQFVSFLVFSGKAGPNNSSPPVDQLKGARVGAKIANGKPYMKDGQQRVSVEVKGFLDPNKGNAWGPSRSAPMGSVNGLRPASAAGFSGAGLGRSVDDDIPF